MACPVLLPNVPDEKTELAISYVLLPKDAVPGRNSSRVVRGESTEVVAVDRFADCGVMIESRGFEPNSETDVELEAMLEA